MIKLKNLSHADYIIIYKKEFDLHGSIVSIYFSNYVFWISLLELEDVAQIRKYEELGLAMNHHIKIYEHHQSVPLILALGKRSYEDPGTW